MFPPSCESVSKNVSRFETLRQFSRASYSSSKLTLDRTRIEMPCDPELTKYETETFGGIIRLVAACRYDCGVFARPHPVNRRQADGTRLDR